MTNSSTTKMRKPTPIFCARVVHTTGLAGFCVRVTLILADACWLEAEVAVTVIVLSPIERGTLRPYVVDGTRVLATVCPFTDISTSAGREVAPRT